MTNNNNTNTRADTARDTRLEAAWYMGLMAQGHKFRRLPWAVRVCGSEARNKMKKKNGVGVYAMRLRAAYNRGRTDKRPKR